MRITFVLIFLGLASFASATDYYVKTGGNDLNSGTSDVTAWATLDKVNSAFSSFKPGDRIMFKSGDTFFGTLRIGKSGVSGSPITFTSYGTGEKPIITGFSTITEWINEGNNIYSANLSSEAQTNMVIVNGRQAAMGRYPDAGSNLVFESFKSSPVSITDNGLGDAVNWSGAEAVINVNDWSLDRCLINDHSGDVLTYTNLGSGAIPTKSGRYFFIQNDLRCLTKNEEWYHSTSENKFYIYGSPSDKTIKISCLNYLIYNNGYDYITIDGLNLAGAIMYGIYMPSGSTYCTVQNSVISFIGESGIKCGNASYHTYENNFISIINRGAIYVTNSGYFKLRNNTIIEIGVIPGGSFRATQNDGMFLYNFSNSLVQYNNITNTGYNGVCITGGNTEIKNNLINHACMLLDDGAAIYTSGGSLMGLVFSNNIILNSGVGNINATLAEGIYLDEYSANITVQNNTIANCIFAGIKNHKGHDNIITHNTCFNNGSGLFLQNSTSTVNLINDLKINNNIFIAKANIQCVLRFYSGADDIPAFGTADYNYYARPVDDDDVFITSSPSARSKYRDLGDWRIFTKQDLNSQKSPVMISDTSKIDFYYNATNSDRIISLTLPMIDVTGKKYLKSVTLQPYTSVVLFIDPNPSQPVVSIHSSAKNNSLVAPATFTVDVNASDPDGSITKVELFNGAIKIGETTTAPYSFTLKDLPEGSYSLTAVATDNMKSVTTSSALVFLVTAYNENMEYFNLYPNPNNGQFSIDFSTNIESDNYTLTVVNIAGKTVHRENISGQSDNIYFNLSHLEAGTYIVMIRNSLIVATAKFIKA